MAWPSGALLASSIQTATVYLLVQADALELLIVIALVYGFGFAGNNTGFVLSIRESVPARSVGMATAIVSLVAWLGMGAGSFAAGWLYDMSGDYTIAFTAAAVAGLLNIAVLLSISRLRARRLRATAGPVLPSLRAAAG